jgi:hypothetical protein
VKRGDKVQVYEDPITCLKPEGVAKTTSKPQPQDYTDAKGRKVYMGYVRFLGRGRGEPVTFRTYSEPAQ